MDQDLQTILDAVEQLRSETNANFGAVQTQLSTMQTQLNTVETRLGTVETRLGTVETRLSRVEHGVLTIAQKLLADGEVAELRAKMRKAG
jgi:flagellin-like hook-associated protein FlgL